MIGQCCNFQGINSRLKSMRYFFRILAAYVILSIMWQYTSIHMITLEWSQIYRKLNLRPSNLQLMPWNIQIQYSYLLISKNITSMVNGSEIRMIEKLETKILRNKNQQCLYLINKWIRGRHGHDHMVVGSISTYAISAYHH